MIPIHVNTKLKVVESSNTVNKNSTGTRGSKIIITTIVVVVVIQSVGNNGQDLRF